jgi:hypothetical protein
MMLNGISTVERAFQLAESGKVVSVSDLRDRLKAEGFADAATQVSGRSIVNQLRHLLRVGQRHA